MNRDESPSLIIDAMVAVFVLIFSLCTLLFGAAAVKYLFFAPAACPCDGCPCCPCPKPTGHGQALPKDVPLETAIVSDTGAEFRWRDQAGTRHVCRLSAEESARLAAAAAAKGEGP